MCLPRAAYKHSIPPPHFIRFCHKQSNSFPKIEVDRALETN